MYVKSVLAMKITSLIKQRKLTEQEAAEMLHVTQARVSALNRGNQLKIFSIDTLISFLTKLDQD